MPIHYEEITCKSALNRVQGMGFRWSLNPYQGCFHACVYCFARAHAKLADRDPGEGFSSNVKVKINVAEVLRQELSKRSWKGGMVAFGTATDPYQPIEGRYRLTRRCLEALRDYRAPVGLITKGTLILRDLDVLIELAKRAHLSVTFSMPTVDEAVWRKTEPGTPAPSQRLRVLRKLVDAGIEAGIGMAPILPGISDSPAQLEAVFRKSAEAGACYVFANPVYLKPGAREYFFNFLVKEFPHLAARYDSWFSGAYLPNAVKNQVLSRVQELKKYSFFPVRRISRKRLLPPEQPRQLSFFGGEGGI